MFLDAFLGGSLIGLAGCVLLLVNGRIMGASGISGVASVGIAKSLFRNRLESFEMFWRITFLLGLLAGSVLLVVFGKEEWKPSVPDQSLMLIALAGVLVGVGTRMGLGCTSGHGVCGMGRASGRSLVATVTFMLSAILTVFFVSRSLQ